MKNDNPLEIIANLGQECLNSSPVIVLGSGASIPYGLPSMGDLKKKLNEIEIPKELLKSQSRWNTMKGNLENQDIETALSNISDNEDLCKFVKRLVWKEINSKDIYLRDELLIGNTKLTLTRLYKHLFNSTHHQISVVTPNYDRLAEYAADIAGCFSFTGFTSGHLCSLKDQPKSLSLRARMEAGHDKIVKIWKVHGSLDWFTSSDNKTKSLTNACRIPEGLEPAIIPPSNGKYENSSQEPFRSIMSNADNDLKKAESYLCIGYGFNDRHIQPKLLERWENKSANPLVILAKTLTDKTKEILSKNSKLNFLALEQDPSTETSTKMFSKETPEGITLEKSTYWKLDDFLSHAIGGS